MKIINGLVAATVISFCSLSCTKNTPPPPADVASSMPATKTVSIESKFLKSADGVEANITITGLQPNSQHGLHIHENGDCSSADFKSAGGHFNPDSHPHGAPGDNSHVGDLGNITADANGHYTGVVKLKNATFDGPHSILNRSLVLHAKTDDLASQPAGDSGDRIACTVINAGT